MPAKWIAQVAYYLASKGEPDATDSERDIFLHLNPYLAADAIWLRRHAVA